MDKRRTEKIQKYVNIVLKECKQDETLTDKEFLKRIKLAEWEDEKRNK